MKVDDLFNRQKPENQSSKKKSIFCASAIDDKIITKSIKQELYNWHFINNQKRFELISAGKTDIAYISSIDFARLKGGYKVIPNICKAVKGRSSRINLFFKQNLGSLNTIAIPPYSSTAQTVLEIVLKEKYLSESKLVISNDSFENNIKKFDAVLLSGDQSLIKSYQNNAYIDLSDEWFDLTGKPLVLGFWLINQNSSGIDDYQILNDAKKKANQITEIVLSEFKDSKLKEYIKRYLSELVYFDWSEEEQTGLDELYRYAFFYGLVDYIPDFVFLDT